MPKVEKRNGNIVDFDSAKIEKAIQKAMIEVEGGLDIELSQKIAQHALEEFCEKDMVNIEEIQ